MGKQLPMVQRIAAAVSFVLFCGIAVDVFEIGQRPELHGSFAEWGYSTGLLLFLPPRSRAFRERRAVAALAERHHQQLLVAAVLAMAVLLQLKLAHRIHMQSTMMRRACSWSDDADGGPGGGGGGRHDGRVPDGAARVTRALPTEAAAAIAALLIIVFQGGLASVHCEFSLVLGFTGGSVFTLVGLTFYTVMRDSTPSPPFYVVFSALFAILIVMLVCKEIDHLHKVRFLQKLDETVSHISTDMQLRNLLPPLNEWEIHDLRARILRASTKKISTGPRNASDEASDAPLPERTRKSCPRI